MAKLSTLHTPTIRTALEDVVQSGQQLILDRIDLLQFEIGQQTNHLAQKIAVHALMGLFGLFGLVALSVALALFLIATGLPAHGAAVCVGLLHFTLAAGLWMWQRGRLPPKAP